MRKFHFTFRRFYAFLIGTVFFMSGVFKLLDPVGNSLVVEEYLRFFHLGFMTPAALVIGIILSLAEGIVGAALISGFKRRLTALVTLGLTLFFTAITVVLYLVNPNMECGCFGLAINLTHGQTLLKNIILLVLWLAAFLPLKELGEPRPGRKVAFWVVAVSLFLFLGWNLRSLPLIDFTSFAPGVELFAAAGDDDENPNHKEPTFIYEKNGQKGSFSIHRLPDSTWTYVGPDTLERYVLITDNETPVLSFMDAEGEYMDEIAADGKVMTISVYAPESTDASFWDKMEAYRALLVEQGVKPVFLLASVPSRIGSLGIPETIKSCLYYADYKTLITLNRSNGGSVYFDNGLLVRKWSHARQPGLKALTRLGYSDPTDSAVNSATKGRIRFQSFLLYTFALMLLL